MECALTIPNLSIMQEHPNYQAEAMGRYLDEHDLESPWSPLPLGDQTEDNRLSHRDRELRVAINSYSIESNSSDPVSSIEKGLGVVNLGGASRSTEWITVSKVKHDPLRFTFESVTEASNSVAAIPHEGEKMLQQLNFVECELEYIAEAGWVKVAMWSR